MNSYLVILIIVKNNYSHFSYQSQKKIKGQSKEIKQNQKG